MNAQAPTRQNPDDQQLRERLREGLAQAPSDGLETLEARALEHWRQRTAAQVSHRGPRAVLQAGWHQHPALVSGALLALALAALLLIKPWAQPDPVLDELLQPDVLSLMAAGEL
jgi:hypothetical protein